MYLLYMHMERSMFPNPFKYLSRLHFKKTNGSLNTKSPCKLQSPHSFLIEWSALLMLPLLLSTWIPPHDFSFAIKLIRSVHVDVTHMVGMEMNVYYLIYSQSVQILCCIHMRSLRLCNIKVFYFVFLLFYA